MFYLDTSAAVASITQEADSERIWAWLAANADAPILCSDWVATEVSSALSIKVRTGAFTLEQRVAAWNNWRRFRDTSLADIVVVPDHFETAAALCDRPDLGLRAGDALHLAVAQSGALSLVTLDRRMADAALQLGISAERI